MAEFDATLSEMANAIYARYYRVPMWQTSVFIADYIDSVGDQLPDILQRLHAPNDPPERILSTAFREEQRKLHPRDKTNAKCMANVILQFFEKTGTNIGDFMAIPYDPEHAARKLAEEQQLYLAKLATDAEDRRAAAIELTRVKAILREANAARTAAYTGPRKIVLVIDAHGAFIVDRKIEPPEHMVDPDYYKRIKFAIESPLTTCAWGSVAKTYEIVKEHYENYPGDEPFDFVRNKLRPITAASMEHTKNSIIEGSADYDISLTPRTRALHKSYILHNIATEQANSLTAENIVGERNYWASYSLDLDENPITKLYTFDSNHKGIYVAASYGMPEMTNPNMRSHNLIDGMLRNAVTRNKITLTRILQILCVAGIEVDIFDCTCSTLRTNMSDAIYVPTGPIQIRRTLSNPGKGKTRKKKSKKSKKSKKPKIKTK